MKVQRREQLEMERRKAGEWMRTAWDGAGSCRYPASHLIPFQVSASLAKQLCVPDWLAVGGVLGRVLNRRGMKRSKGKEQEYEVRFGTLEENSENSEHSQAAGWEARPPLPSHCVQGWSCFSV